MFRIEVHDEVTSTNLEVKRALRAGESEGLVVRAYRQSGGYGRQGRSWASPLGGLYCSWLLRPFVSPGQLPTLSLVVALAFRHALASLADEGLAECVKVKWPNDVVVDLGAPTDRGEATRSLAKLVGISLEAVDGGVCVGTGVNVVRPEGECLEVGGKNEPAFMADLSRVLAQQDVQRAVDAVFDAVRGALEDYYHRWRNEGFAPFRDEFNGRHALAGRRVEVIERAGGLLGSGTVHTVDCEGRLVLLTNDGAELSISSGEAHIAALE